MVLAVGKAEFRSERGLPHVSYSLDSLKGVTRSVHVPNNKVLGLSHSSYGADFG